MPAAIENFLSVLVMMMRSIVAHAARRPLPALHAAAWKRRADVKTKKSLEMCAAGTGDERHLWSRPFGCVIFVSLITREPPTASRRRPDDPSGAGLARERSERESGGRNAAVSVDSATVLQARRHPAARGHADATRMSVVRPRDARVRRARARDAHRTPRTRRARARVVERAPSRRLSRRLFRS